MYFLQYVHVFRLPGYTVSLAGALPSCTFYYFSNVSCRILSAWKSKVESVRKLYLVIINYSQYGTFGVFSILLISSKVNCTFQPQMLAKLELFTLYNIAYVKNICTSRRKLSPKWLDNLVVSERVKPPLYWGNDHGLWWLVLCPSIASDTFLESIAYTLWI